MSLRRDPKGYTLMEVMVALVIVALSLGAIFQNLSQSRRTALRSQKALKAVRLAHNLFLDEVSIAGVMRGEMREGDIEGEEGWSYALSAEPLVLEGFGDEGADQEIEGTKKLTLCVRHTAGDRQQSFCFTKWRGP